VISELKVDNGTYERVFSLGFASVLKGKSADTATVVAWLADLDKNDRVKVIRAARTVAESYYDD
jgi:cell division inhibitor SulA